MITAIDVTKWRKLAIIHFEMRRTIEFSLPFSGFVNRLDPIWLNAKSKLISNYPYFLVTLIKLTITD